MIPKIVLQLFFLLCPVEGLKITTLPLRKKYIPFFICLAKRRKLLSQRFFYVLQLMFTKLLSYPLPYELMLYKACRSVGFVLWSVLFHPIKQSLYLVYTFIIFLTIILSRYLFSVYVGFSLSSVFFFFALLVYFLFIFVPFF